MSDTKRVINFLLDYKFLMSTKRERKKVPVKSVFNHVIRAKLYGILTINSIEGIMHEIDEMLPQETLDGFDLFL